MLLFLVFCLVTLLFLFLSLFQMLGLFFWLFLVDLFLDLVVLFLFDYLPFHGFFNMVVFFVIIRYLNDFRFFFQENPALAVFCVVFLFSISGLPSLVGFYSKMFVFFCVTLLFFIFVLIV